MPSAMDKLEKYLAEKSEVQETETRLLRQVAYDRLQDGIKHANLVPGEPLSETRISKALGISRTPVREALQQLAQEGLVQIIPGRAITVAAPSIQEVLEAIHVRELLEPELVRLAAESLSDQGIASLQTALQEMEEAARKGDHLAWSKADMTFHELLSRFCPNHLLGQLVLQTHNRVSPPAHGDQVTDNLTLEHTTEHRQVVEAILNHDADTAEKLMRDHIQRLRHGMFRHLIRY